MNDIIAFLPSKMIYKRLSQFSNLLFFEVEDITSWLQCLSFYLLIHLNPPPLVENLSSYFFFFFSPLLHKSCLPWFLRILFLSNLFLSVIHSNKMRSNNYRIWSSKALNLSICPETPDPSDSNHCGWHTHNSQRW